MTKNNIIYTPDEIRCMSLDDIFTVEKIKDDNTCTIKVRAIFCNYPCFKIHNSKNFAKAVEYLYAFWDVDGCVYEITDEEIDEYKLCKARIKQFCKDIINAYSYISIDKKYIILEVLLNHMMTFVKKMICPEMIIFGMFNGPMVQHVQDICKNFLEFVNAHESMMFKLTD